SPRDEPPAAESDGRRRHGRARGVQRRCARDRRGEAGGRRGPMIVLSGAALVLPDRILSPGTLFIDGDRIADIRSGDSASGHPHPLFAFHGHYIVPGFVDVHVHGIEGVDTLDAVDDAVKSIAARLPRYGVTGFCPTTVACAPDEL